MTAMIVPEFHFQAFPERVPCLRLVRIVQLLPGVYDDDDDDEEDDDDGDDDDDDDDDDDEDGDDDDFPTWSKQGHCL